MIESFFHHYPTFVPAFVACFASIGALVVGIRNKQRLTDLNIRIDQHLEEMIKLLKDNK